MGKQLIIKYKDGIVYTGHVDSRQSETTINLDQDPGGGDEYLTLNDVDQTIVEDSKNPVSGGAVYTALDGINTILESINGD